MMARRKRRISLEVVTGITEEMGEALENAVTFVGTTQSQYCRQAILEKLLREGFLRLPPTVNKSAPVQKAEIHAA